MREEGAGAKLHNADASVSQAQGPTAQYRTQFKYHRQLNGQGAAQIVVAVRPLSGPCNGQRKLQVYSQALRSTCKGGQVLRWTALGGLGSNAGAGAISPR